MQVEILEVECPYCGQNGILEVDPSAGESQEITSDCEICCRPIRFEISIDLGADDEEAFEAFEDEVEEENDAYPIESENPDEDEEHGLEAEDSYGRHDAFEAMTGAKKKSRKSTNKDKSDPRIHIGAFREEDV